MRSLHIIQVCLVLILIVSCQNSTEADLVIHNGVIYTMNDSRPTASMVAVKDGMIVSVGDEAGAQEWLNSTTSAIDLNGRAMSPGLIESHGHIIGLGNSRMRLDLTGCANYDEVVQMVAEAVENTQPGEWILGRGWHQSKWDPQPDPLVRGFQTHHALSAVSPDNPVFLTHASGHASIANAKAMEIAGITSETAFEKDGEVIKDDAGNPTGILVELAEDLVDNHVPDETPETYARALRLAIEECLRNGITTFCDAGSGSESLDTYYRALDDGKLDLRLWVMLRSREPGLLEKYYEMGPQIGLGNGYLTIRAIKLYGDGALGSRGAWLLSDYEDRPGHFGHETMPMDSIYLVARDGLKHGFQACTHAIGDRTNREVLDAYQRALEENPEKATDHRFRIEHAQHLNAADINRFAELGVIASMQGIHMSSDRPWAIDRLGSDRIIEGAYVWKKLLDSGARICNGTDVPVEPVSPIASFYASVTRKTLKGTPEGGYEPEQVMTREQALRSYTLDAAYAAFEEDVKGSIEVGKMADFTVYSQDIMTIDESKLLDTQIDYTIVGGRVVFERE